MLSIHSNVNRSIYRVIELADGWLGRVIRTEVYFSAFFTYPLSSVINCFPWLLIDVLDGVMITLAIYTFNVIHPGYFLADNDVEDNEKARGVY